MGNSGVAVPRVVRVWMSMREHVLKMELGLITACLGGAGQHCREKDDQEGAKKEKKKA